MTKILLVDDEAGIRQLLRLTLEMDGFQVFEAGDGPQAIETYQKEMPELALLDVKLPGMSGIEVLERLRKINSDVEVIMITGHGDMEMAIECLRREASNFLIKPVSEELLSLSLKRCLEKLTLKKKLRQYTQNLETLVREANIELERAYTFRENIIENCPDALICIRKGGEIILFNSAAEKLLGYSKRDVLGKMNIVDLYPPGVAHQIMKYLRSEDYGGKGLLQKREMQILHKSGEPISVYISAALLYEGGQETGSVGIFTDLTKRKKMEKQLLRSAKFSSLGKLAGGIAHEIDQPLTKILASAHTLSHQFSADPGTAESLDQIIEETNKIKSIVKNVMDFSQENPPTKSSSRIHDIIQRALGIMTPQTRLAGITINTEFNPQVPDVSVDANQILQAVMNIVINAAEAMKGEGILTIRTNFVAPYVELEFEDTGPGIPEEKIENVFDPFFTTKQASEGSVMGLGLAITYGIVKNHGGDVTVSSPHGKGATFCVKLPVSQE